MFEGIENKRVLITGSSSGIGAEVARLFAGHGAKIGIHYRQSLAEAEKLLADVKGIGGHAVLLQCDLLDACARRSLVDSFVSEFGGIDILVDNAGGYDTHVHFMELAEESLDTAYELNVKAPFVLMREAYSHMKAGGWGRIINISTTAIKYVGAASLHYTSAKSAMETLTRGFARDGAEHNVLVNAIRCGVIDTPMRTKIEGYDEAAFQHRASLIPVKRLGQTKDVAGMVLFLASKGGDFITGEVITVAGGD